VTSHDLGGLEGLADRVGILHAGRLLLDEPKDTLKARFRRLRLPAGVAPDWGSFTVVATESQPWGQEAIVSDFDEDRLQALRALHNENAPEVVGLTLEEIFLAVCGKKGAGE
jgi:ABC-type multidrug transport system ATPase subunit